MRCLPESFYKRSTEQVAKELVGKTLVRTLKASGRTLRLQGIIVETEAYGHSDDAASHAHNGQTIRNSVMFGEVGRAYVYFTYGNHHCVNVSARSEKSKAGAVLIRAVEPVGGIEIMRRFRKVEIYYSLTSGPGKLTQALNITRVQNGADVTDAGSELCVEKGEKRQVVATLRIGITRAVEKNWRFVDPTSPFVSRRPRVTA